MAAATTEPQLDELKKRARRRLVGAIVLALIAAVVVPMLLESEPKPLGEDVSVRIPPVDQGRFVNKIGDARHDKAPAGTIPGKPVGEPAGNAPAPAKVEPSAEPPAPPASAPAPQDARADKARASLNEAERRVIAPPAKASDAAKAPADAVRPAGETIAKVPGETPKAVADAPKAAADASKPAADASRPAPEVTRADGNFSVQLAAFADDKGANALAAKLKRAGYNAYTEPYTTSRGTLWRVRVGPFASRDAAEAARDKLKGEGQTGIIAAAR